MSALGNIITVVQMSIEGVKLEKAVTRGDKAGEGSVGFLLAAMCLERGQVTLLVVSMVREEETCFAMLLELEAIQRIGEVSLK